MRYSILIIFSVICFSCSSEKTIGRINVGPTLADTGVIPTTTDNIITIPEVEITTQIKCPENMVFIDGEYCPQLQEECLEWIDKTNKDKKGNISPNMCKEFKFPTKCLSKDTVHMSFCMDKYEWPNVLGEIPETNMSWLEAKSNCESVGKRLCDSREFEFACEGTDYKPYPYGDGYHRSNSVCNNQNKWLDPEKNSFFLLDKRAPSGSHPECKSDSGVYDIVGNVDEWVKNPYGSMKKEPYTSGLMGGHWVYGVRHRCRAITTSHDPSFTYYVTGSRCCKDI